MGIQHSMCVQPAFLIGTYDEDGNVNFAPITWVSVTCDADHFMLVISKIKNLIFSGYKDIFK